MPRRAGTLLFVALATCGRSSVEWDTGTSAPEASTSGSPTTGIARSCEDVELPQDLPAGTLEPYFGWDGDYLVVRFMKPGLACPKGLECPNDYTPGLLGYSVRIGPDRLAPGVYPAFAPGPASAQIWVGAISLEDEGCGVSAWQIAWDGAVEIIAMDDDCVAIDIRGVTTAPEGMNPNGSGRARSCQ